MKTKSAAEAAKKWSDSIGRVPAAYQAGVAATNDQKEKSLAAEELYKQRVIERANAGARAKGIEATPDSKWKDNALKKGASRIGPGMQAAKPDYDKGIAKVISTLQSVDLPARTADPDTNIDNRVKPIARALRAMKESK